MATTYIHRTPASTGSNTVWTMSMWFKRKKVDTAHCLWNNGSSTQTQIQIGSDNQIVLYNGATTVFKTPARVYDTMSWSHIVVAVDTGESGTDKVKCYLNGLQITTMEADNRSTASAFNNVNVSGEEMDIGSTGSGSYFDGCMSHINFIDGTQYPATAFGSYNATDGIWEINTSPTVTYGTNGYFLKMEDSSNLDLDSGTNAFTFTTVGELSRTKDTPSNSFCALNPLYPYGSGVNVTNDGGTSFVGTQGNANRMVAGDKMITSGKYYYEVKINTVSANNEYTIGWRSNWNLFNGTWADAMGSGGIAPSYGLQKDGTLNYSTNAAYNQTDTGWTTYTTGDTICCAIDLDNNFMYWGKDGVWMKSGDPTSGSTGTGGFAFVSGYSWFPAAASTEGSSGSTVYMSFNFGNGTFANDSGAPTVVTSEGTNASNNGIFEYDVPTGYGAICTKQINGD